VEGSSCELLTNAHRLLKVHVHTCTHTYTHIHTPTSPILIPTISTNPLAVSLPSRHLTLSCQFDGIFVLCSLHGADLLAPLLATPALDMRASLHPLGRGGGMGTVAICRKGTRSCSAGGVAGGGIASGRDVDEDALRQEEKFIMDEYYKAQNPLLGAEQVTTRTRTHTHTHTRTPRTHTHTHTHMTYDTF
jgi:hypothetical protein